MVGLAIIQASHWNKRVYGKSVRCLGLTFSENFLFAEVNRYG